MNERCAARASMLTNECMRAFVMVALLCFACPAPGFARDGARPLPGVEQAAFSVAISDDVSAARRKSDKSESRARDKDVREASPQVQTRLHQLDIGGKPLRFLSSVSRIRVRMEAGHGEVGIISFVADPQSKSLEKSQDKPHDKQNTSASDKNGAEKSTRPVTFVIGGGPGTSSAFLNLGAVGPWRIALNGAPSQMRDLEANPQSWLAFTDLVFLDPPGTGLGRVNPDNKDNRARAWSVDGDRDLLTEAISNWIVTTGRRASPIIIAGQSYGGLRAPRIADQLRQRGDIAVSGIILISPMLDYGWRYQGRTSPLPMATLLPSFAATMMEAEGKFAEKDLSEVETYAAGAFIADYLRGPADVAAVERMVRRVTTITGLPADLVRAAHGRIDEAQFAREFQRAKGRVLSTYDASIAGTDPEPSHARPASADPFLAALRAPLSLGMTQLLTTHLATRERNYIVANEDAFEHWDWGHDGGMPESVTALRRVLALDPQMRVFAVHGFQDLQTPYFETKLILDQFGDLAGARILRKTYPGGHMFYSRDASRAAFAQDAAQFYAALLHPPEISETARGQTRPLPDHRLPGAGRAIGSR